MEDLKKLIAVVSRAKREMIESVGPHPRTFDSVRLDRWHKRQRAALRKLQSTLKAEGATFTQRGDCFAVKLRGIRSTCTSGFSGAVNNWIALARKRLPQET